MNGTNMEHDFEDQLNRIVEEIKAELGRRAQVVISKHAAAGRYQSGATVQVLKGECEDVFDQLVSRIIEEVRFFKTNTALPLDELVLISKKVVRKTQSELFEISGLSHLFKVLKMQSLSDQTQSGLDNLLAHADLAFRKLEIESPMLEDLMNDRFRLLGSDGEVKVANLKGAYSEGQIITFNTQTAILKGDHLLRFLPNNHVEDYIVMDPNFMQGLQGIKPSYQTKVMRSDEPEAPPQQVIQHITNNVSGPNARVNIGSIDNSVNIVDQSTAQIFQNLRSTAESNILESDQLSQILDAIEAMKETHGTDNFIGKYQAFIQAAAAHMTIFTPLLPALTKLLPGG